MSKRLKKVKSSINRSLLSIAALMIVLVSYIPVYGGTVEIVYMTPHYRHPVTGVIEDPGQNEDIGQGMTESVLFPQALLETDDRGRIYLTTRNKLAQHISSMKFAVQKTAGIGYTPVSYEVTATGEDYKDTRFQIPARNSVIRMEFYVEPMGRTVIFYGSMGKIVPGNTDFKVFVNVGAAADVSVASVEKVSLETEETMATLEDNEEVGNAQIAEQTTGEAGKAIGFDHGLLTRNSPEVKRLLGKDIEKKDEISGAPYGEVTKFVLQVLAIVIGILVSAVILTAAALPMYYKILKGRNDRREMNLYAREDKLRKR